MKSSNPQYFKDIEKMNTYLATLRKPNKYQFITDIEKIMAINLIYLGYVLGDTLCYQYPLMVKYGFIADFFIPEKNLIIECNGERWHQDKLRETRRTAVFKRKGYKLIAFTGTEIKDVVFRETLTKKLYL